MGFVTKTSMLHTDFSCVLISRICSDFACIFHFYLVLFLNLSYDEIQGHILFSLTRGLLFVLTPGNIIVIRIFFLFEVFISII